MRKNLTNIEERIYDYIYENSLSGKWVSQKDIRNHLINNNYVGDICLRNIRRYINNIRNCDSIDKIIITNYKNGYKIISSEEERKLLINEKVKVLKMLKTCYKNIERYNKNNHFKINYDSTDIDIYNSLL